MHPSWISLLAILCLAAFATAVFIPCDLFDLDPDQVTFNDGTIKECGSSRDILRVEYIRIKPDPPVKGESLTVDFKGYLYEEVTEGSTVDVKVKYGAIKLLQKQFDLCEEAKQVNRTCPIEKGDFHLIHTADIPKDIPPGKYTILAEVRTEDKRPITCLTAVVIFRP